MNNATEQLTSNKPTPSLVPLPELVALAVGSFASALAKVGRVLKHDRQGDWRSVPAEMQLDVGGLSSKNVKVEI